MVQISVFSLSLRNGKNDMEIEKILPETEMFTQIKKNLVSQSPAQIDVSHVHL